MGYEGSYTLVAPALAISVVDVDPGDFSTLTFSVLSGHVGAKPEVRKATATTQCPQVLSSSEQTILSCFSASFICII